MEIMLVKGNAAIIKLLHIIMVTALLTLPYTHPKFIPNFMGDTRPITSVLLGLAFAILLLGYASRGRLLAAPNFVGANLKPLLLLIIIGVVNIPFVFLYGNVEQAIYRLIGYLIIIVMIYMTLVGSWLLEPQKFARWIFIGYLPVVVYGLIEILAMHGLSFAKSIVALNYEYFLFTIVSMPGFRLHWFASEPSYLAFHLMLLIFIFPLIKLKYKNLWLVLIAVEIVYTKSLTVYLTGAIYVAFLFVFTALHKRKLTARHVAYAACCLLLLAAGLFIVYHIPYVHAAVERFTQMQKFTSIQIRWAYILNIVYIIRDTWGLGLGIGQYGEFWKSYYLPYIDYQRFDALREVDQAIHSDVYMKPRSVLLGVGADFGIIGITILAVFFYRIARLLQTPHDKSVFVCVLFSFAGAHPMVTPHCWMILALLIYRYQYNEKLQLKS